MMGSSESIFKKSFSFNEIMFTEYLLLMNFYNNINFLSLYTSKVTPNFCLLEIKYSSDPKRNSLNVFTLSSKIVSNFFQAVIMSIFNKQKNPPWICPLYHLLKFRYSEKAPKIWKNPTFFLTLLSNFKKMWKIFSNFAAFSQYLNFRRW